MLRALALVALIFLAACQTARAPATPSADPAHPYIGGDGRTPATAVVINSASVEAGVAAEYSWMRTNYPGAKVLRQTTSALSSDRPELDTLEWQDSGGEERSTYFAIVINGGTDACSQALAVAVQDSTHHMDTWLEIYDGSRRYALCDKCPMPECALVAKRYSNAVVHRLATDWASLDQAASLMRRSRAFHDFVMQRIDPTADADELATVRDASLDHCLPNLQPLCADIHAAALSAIGWQGPALGSAQAAIPWEPDLKIIAAVERVVKLPKRAARISFYTRYYAGVIENGHRILEGVYDEGDDEGDGRVIIVDTAKKFPVIFDGGCEIIHLSYDVDARRLLSISCNGEA